MLLMTVLWGCGSTDPLLVEWVEEDVTGSQGMVGGMVAGPYVVGGLRDDLSIATAILSVDATTSLTFDAAASLGTERFCGCALYDDEADEVVAFGGRTTDFQPSATAERVDVAADASTPITGAEQVGTIGCSAVFTSAGLGYVFGGGRGAFSADTWRYDPSDSSLTLLDVEGPSARYDAGTLQLPDGDMLLVSGMGASDAMQPVFHTDVWRFDVDTETWSEIPVSGDFEGRRFPFITLGPDAAFVYVGYGSDHPGGQSVLGDLWALELETGVFTELDADTPRDRGFALSLPGPEGALGTMAFGGDAQSSVVEDAWTLFLQ